MKLTDAVKTEKVNVSSGSNSIYFDESSSNWVVLTRHYKARHNIVLDEAVKVLLEG